MKILPFILMLSLFVTSGFAQTYTNGVYVNNGITVEVDKKVHEITPTNKSEILYFSNELIAQIYTNSTFQINSFFQEVYPTTTPKVSKFGAANFAGTLLNGTAIFKYAGHNTNDNSSCVVSTPMVDLELHHGTFYFKVNEGKVLVFVLDGELKSIGDKGRENVVTKGYAVIAVPNDIGILEAKISLGAEKVKQTIIQKLNEESLYVLTSQDTVIFATVNGKVVGILKN